MRPRICLGADTHRLPKAGGHLWVYLHWALGLRSIGCDVVWLEVFNRESEEQRLAEAIQELRQRLQPFGLADSVAACDRNGDSLPGSSEAGILDLEAAAEADALLDIGGKFGSVVINRFARSALIDIDPGLLQVWIAASGNPIAEHDVYFSIGETVGTPAATFPDCGVPWHYTPVPIHLDTWSPSRTRAPVDAPYTTVTSWWGWWEVLGEELVNNEKRTSFLEVLELPRLVDCQLELAVALWGKGSDHDFSLLREHGWRICDAFEIADTPIAYRNYLQASRGEFSCAKPSCLRLRNAWLSDRTLAYMALEKPVIIQHTGASQYIPDGAGVIRFRNLEEARHGIKSVEDNYERHARAARAFVEEQCDAAKVVRAVLERVL